MAWHNRYVIPDANSKGGLRTNVSFIREDLLYAPDTPWQHPHGRGGAKLQLPLSGLSSGRLPREIYIGPNVADIVVRIKPDDEQEPPRWSLRPATDFFCPPKQRSKLGSDEHPFFKRLSTGGTFLAYEDGFVRVQKRSSVSISSQVFRLTIGMKGTPLATTRHIGDIARAAWDRDLVRARELYDLIVKKKEILDEDVPPELKAAATISQTVENAILP